MPFASNDAMSILGTSMRVLQARRHFFATDTDPLIVAHVVWPTDSADSRGSLDCTDAQPIIRPTFTSAPHNWPIQLVAELEELIDRARPDPFYRLQLMKGGAWSFIDVSVSGGTDDQIKTAKRVLRTTDGRVPAVIVVS
jgi:hypothetical protein